MQLIKQGNGLKKCIIFICVMITYLCSGALLVKFGLKETDQVFMIIHVVIAIILLVIMLMTIRTTKITTERIGFRRHTRLPLLVMTIVMILLMLIDNVLPNFVQVFHHPATILMVTLTAVMAGVFEELSCRGLLFSGLLTFSQNSRHPLISSAIWSSLIFGCLHLFNIISEGQGVEVTVQQVFYATVIGVFFAAIRVAANGLLIPIILHSMIDFTPNITSVSSSVMDWTSLLIVFIPILVVALWGLWAEERVLK